MTFRVMSCRCEPPHPPAPPLPFPLPPPRLGPHKVPKRLGYHVGDKVIANYAKYCYGLRQLPQRARKPVFPMWCSFA